LELAGLRGDVAFAQTEHGLSERTACKLLGVERSSYRYEPRPDRNAELREVLVKLARQKPRYGYRRLHALLSRRGYEVNVKRVYTITPEALKGLFRHHHGDLMKRGLRNLAVFEAYLEYCFSPKHTVGEQLLNVRRDKRERAAFAVATGNRAGVIEEDDESDDDDPETDS